MAKTELLKTASVLAFERKLDPSDALFQAGKWDDRDHGKQWPTVNVREKSVRGTISNRLKGGRFVPTNGGIDAVMDLLRVRPRGAFPTCLFPEN